MDKAREFNNQELKTTPRRFLPSLFLAGILLSVLPKQTLQSNS